MRDHRRSPSIQVPIPRITGLLRSYLTGMRWEVEGAQAVLSLRAIKLNDDWKAFHAARIQAEQRTLYPYRDHLAGFLNHAA